ncbi:SS18-like protein 2 [Acipenser oxyrinchus oxyrinchus]|uniref:SS18-like protein 2 n=1 Tax=Acipenser oxyrinchus oxyrinchus TaxID=40147 RepID=A0AAD8D743_ACIOX|nr:SS18-like protein 2 [Acipenser oxyrinchus oxyrinchus]
MNGYVKNMSIVFVPEKLRGRAQINQEIIQRLLEENDQLVRIIVEYQRKGRAAECVRYQQILHRNLVYLATIADTSPNILPAAPTTENMGICAAGQVQSEESKSLSPPAGKENTDTWGGTQ